MTRRLRVWMRRPGLVAQGALQAWVLQGAGLALGYAVHVVLARWLGATAYGVYAYVLAWVALLALPVGMGLPLLMVRFVPEYRVEARWGLLRGLLRWSGVGVLAAGVGVALTGTALLGWVGGDGAYTHALRLGLWLVPVQALLSVMSGTYRGFQRLGHAYALPVMRHTALLALALLLWAWTPNPTSLHALGATLLAALVVLLAMGAVLWRGLPASVRQATAAYTPRTWLRVSFPLFFVGASAVVLQQTDVLMVGALLEPLDAGLYRAASRTAVLVALAPVALGAAADPMLARLYARGERRRLQRLAAGVARWATGASLAGALLLVALGRPVLALFGEAFVDAYGVLLVLAAGQVCYAAVGLAAGLLNLTGHHGVGMRIFAGSAVLNVLLNAAGIVLLGRLGAALATAATLVVMSALLWHQARRHVGVDASIIHALRRRV